MGRGERIRIAFIIGSAEVGGAEHVLLSLLRSLPAEGFDCSVLCPSSGPLVTRYAQAASRIGTMGERSFMHPLVIGRMAALLRRWKVDVVHTCLYGSDVGGVLAARLAGVPRIVSHIVGHNFYVTEERGVRRMRKQWLSWIYRWIYALSDQLIAVSEAVKADLIGRRGIRVPARKIVVIRHSLSPERPAVAPERLEDAKRLCAITDTSVVLATVASLIPLKGHRYLVEALPEIVRALPQVRCVIVGEGSSRRTLEQLVRRLHLAQHVVFTGVLDDARRNAILQVSRVVVLPSLSEGLPVVLLEAMAFGKPVVATDAGGTREVVEDRRTGFLVPPADPEALAAALLPVLSDAQLAQRLGQAGRRRFEAAFPSSAFGARMQAFYRRLVDGR